MSAIGTNTAHLTSIEKCLYHQDDDRKTCKPDEQGLNAALRRNMLATACLIQEQYLEERNDHTFVFTNGVYTLAQKLALKPELFGGRFEGKYHDELAPGSSSSFFIGGSKRNKVLTAGHCVIRSYGNIRFNELPDLAVTSKIRIVFKFIAEPKKDQEYIIQNKHVYLDLNLF